ncbi:hypothetical protein ACSVBT_13740 [Afipia sp. TerB]
MRIRTAHVVVVLLIFATAAAAAALLVSHPWMEPAQAVPDRRITFVMPSSNTVAKRDKLEVSTPEPADTPPAAPVNLSFETALQYMASPPSEIWSAKPAGPAKPSTILLDDKQIASIKQRLKLTKAQLELWPPVEKALKDLLELLHDRRRQSPEKVLAANGDAVKRLTDAGAPLFAKLRPDQRNEVKALARMVGLASELPD